MSVARALDADLRAAPFTAPRLVYIYRCHGCGQEWRRGRRVQRDMQYYCLRCTPRFDERFRMFYAGVRREVAAPPAAL